MVVIQLPSNVSKRNGLVFDFFFIVFFERGIYVYYNGEVRFFVFLSVFELFNVKDFPAESRMTSICSPIGELLRRVSSWRLPSLTPPLDPPPVVTEPVA